MYELMLLQLALSALMAMLQGFSIGAGFALGWWVLNRKAGRKLPK